MEAIVAKSAGFCFGVKRAVETCYEEAESDKKIYTYGPIIHNEQVVADLEEKGVHVVNEDQDLSLIDKGTMIIRSHGVARDIEEKIKAAGFECVDATCPFVKRIHKLVDEAGREGRNVIIVGNPGHPEVEGIRGWCTGPAAVIETPEDADGIGFDTGIPVLIVCQTTFQKNKFEELVDILNKKGYNANVVNTICNATQERQEEAKQIASTVDAMIVIGGAHSSNTRKLYEICSGACGNTVLLQTLGKEGISVPKDVSSIGITAGASTPSNIIREVQNYVRTYF